MSQSGPRVSCTWTRYWIACFDGADAAGGLHADLAAGLVVNVADRLEHHEVHRQRRRGGILPVDVLMKSAPAAIASSEARRTLS